MYGSGFASPSSQGPPGRLLFLPAFKHYPGGTPRVGEILIDAIVAIFGIYGVDFARRVRPSGVYLEFIEKLLFV